MTTTSYKSDASFWPKHEISNFQNNNNKKVQKIKREYLKDSNRITT